MNIHSTNFQNDRSTRKKVMTTGSDDGRPISCNIQKISFKKIVRWARNTNKKNRAQPDSCRRPTCPAAGHPADKNSTKKYKKTN